MKLKMIRTMSVIFGVVLVVSLSTLTANAQCGASDRAATSAAASRLLEKPVSLRFASYTSSRLAAGQENKTEDVSIVGFWHVTFTSEGTTNPPIPDGAVVDKGFSQWHSDGTEILNSSRPPATSNFCLGVWEKTGRSTYKLNHFALSSDLNGNLVGPANIREDVTLDANGNSYSGTFSIDQFDLSGHTLAHIVGAIKATRITVDTTISDIL
jgi:hypothetical protein